MYTPLKTLFLVLLAFGLATEARAEKKHGGFGLANLVGSDSVAETIQQSVNHEPEIPALQGQPKGNEIATPVVTAFSPSVDDEEILSNLPKVGNTRIQGLSEVFTAAPETQSPGFTATVHTLPPTDGGNPVVQSLRTKHDLDEQIQAVRGMLGGEPAVSTRTVITPPLNLVAAPEPEVSEVQEPVRGRLLSGLNPGDSPAAKLAAGRAQNKGLQYFKLSNASGGVDLQVTLEFNGAVRGSTKGNKVKKVDPQTRLLAGTVDGKRDPENQALLDGRVNSAERRLLGFTGRQPEPVYNNKRQGLRGKSSIRTVNAGEGK